jgi:hypothetical protein
MSTMPEPITFAKKEVEPFAAEVRRIVGSKLPPSASFEQREAAMLAVSNEAVRIGLEVELQAIADDQGEELTVDGAPYKVHEPGTVEYHSLCGPLSVRRSTYRRVGERNGPTVVPLDLAAGLVERSTPALAHSVALGYAKHDLRSHGEDLVAAHRIPPSRTTLERVAQRTAETVQEHAPSIAAYVRRGEQLPQGAHAITTGLDRTTVPMEELWPAGVTKKPVRRTKPRVRRTPAPVTVNYRMAYVGTVSIVDAQGEALVTRKYAIPAEDDPVTGVVAKMVADVRAAKRQKPTMAVGIVQDGGKEMWSLVRDGLAKEPTVGKVFEGIDRYHLLERLAKALEIIEPEAAARRAQLEIWKHDFDLRDSAIDSVEHWLHKRHLELEPAAAEKLWEHLVYLRNNKDRMRYVTLRLEGLPVGSGVTEGAAKSVVGVRTKGRSERWKPRGLRNALMLRSWYCSDRFAGLWRHLSRRYAADVANR